jgi:hypothetical protein
MPALASYIDMELAGLLLPLCTNSMRCNGLLELIRGSTYVLGWEEEASRTSFALAEGRYLVPPPGLVPSGEVQLNEL